MASLLLGIIVLCILIGGFGIVFRFASRIIGTILYLAIVLAAVFLMVYVVF